MKVKNETQYSTRALRSIFTETYRRLAKHEGPHPLWHCFTFYVGYSRRRWASSGRAPLRGSYVKLFLEKPALDTARLAKLVDHELLHTYGYKHRQMVGGRAYHSEAYNESFAWAREMFGAMLTIQSPKPKVKADTQSHRATLVENGILRWTKRLKYAQTKLRTLRAKQRYYARALAAKRALGNERRRPCIIAG